MSTVGRGRGVRPRRIALPPQQIAAGTDVATGNVSVGIDMLRQLFDKLKHTRCTPEAGGLLLKLMKENCIELEKYNQDLVDAIMHYVYPEVMTTDSALVRLTLLQLVEMRARNWRHDPAAEQFYASKRLTFANQQQIKLQQMDKGFGDAAGFSRGRSILKMSPHMKQGIIDCDSGGTNNRNVRGPVLGRGTTEQAKMLLPQVRASMPGNAHDQPMDEGLRRAMLSAHQHLVREFEAMKRSVNPQNYHDKLPTPYVPPPTRVAVSDVAGIADLLTPVLQGRMTMTGSGQMGNQMHPLGCGLEQMSRMVPHPIPATAVAAILSKMPTDAGVKFDAAAMIGMRKAYNEGKLYGGGVMMTPKVSNDAGRKQDAVAVVDGSQELRSSKAESVCSGTSSATVSGTGADRPEFSHLSAPGDTADIGAGDAVATLPNGASLTNGGWAGWQKPKADEPLDEEDESKLETQEDDKEQELSEEKADETEPAENDMTADVKESDAKFQLEYKYDRAFLINCGRRLKPDHVPKTWATLCTKFKGICLHPQEAKPCLPPTDAPPSNWTILRPPPRFM